MLVFALFMLEFVWPKRVSPKYKVLKEKSNWHIPVYQTRHFEIKLRILWQIIVQEMP